MHPDMLVRERVLAAAVSQAFGQTRTNQLMVQFLGRDGAWEDLQLHNRVAAGNFEPVEDGSLLHLWRLFPWLVAGVAAGAGCWALSRRVCPLDYAEKAVLRWPSPWTIPRFVQPELKVLGCPVYTLRWGASVAAGMAALWWTRGLVPTRRDLIGDQRLPWEQRERRALPRV